MSVQMNYISPHFPLQYGTKYNYILSLSLPLTCPTATDSHYWCLNEKKKMANLWTEYATMSIFLSSHQSDYQTRSYVVSVLCDPIASHNCDLITVSPSEQNYLRVSADSLIHRQPKTFSMCYCHWFSGTSLLYMCFSLIQGQLSPHLFYSNLMLCQCVSMLMHSFLYYLCLSWRDIIAIFLLFHLHFRFFEHSLWVHITIDFLLYFWFLCSRVLGWGQVTNLYCFLLCICYTTTL